MRNDGKKKKRKKRRIVNGKEGGKEEKVKYRQHLPTCLGSNSSSSYRVDSPI